MSRSRQWAIVRHRPPSLKMEPMVLCIGPRSNRAGTERATGSTCGARSAQVKGEKLSQVLSKFTFSLCVCPCSSARAGKAVCCNYFLKVSVLFSSMERKIEIGRCLELDDKGQLKPGLYSFSCLILVYVYFTPQCVCANATFVTFSFECSFFH